MDGFLSNISTSWSLLDQACQHLEDHSWLSSCATADKGYYSRSPSTRSSQVLKVKRVSSPGSLPCTLTFFNNNQAVSAHLAAAIHSFGRSLFALRQADFTAFHLQTDTSKVPPTTRSLHSRLLHKGRTRSVSCQVFIATSHAGAHCALFNQRPQHGFQSAVDNLFMLRGGCIALSRILQHSPSPWPKGSIETFDGLSLVALNTARYPRRKRHLERPSSSSTTRYSP